MDDAETIASLQEQKARLLEANKVLQREVDRCINDRAAAYSQGYQDGHARGACRRGH